MKKSLLIMMAASMAFGVAAADLSEGTEYFIRNAENGYYITGGYSWGTLAVQKESGRAFELVADGSAYKLKSSCGFIKDGGDEMYVDGDDNSAIALTLIPEGNQYVISYNNRYLGENEVMDNQEFGSWHWGNYMSENTVISLKWKDDAAEAIKWDFMTKADVHKAMEAATEASPIDVSFFLKAHNIEINDTENATAWTYVRNGEEVSEFTFPMKGWQDEFGGDQWHNKSTYIWCQNDGADGAEEGTDLLYQECEGAPAGVYEAHYRVLNQSNTPLVINLNDTKAAATEFEDEDLWYAEAYRELHEYEETARFAVKEDGKISIKLEKTINPDEQNRFAFKSMRLKYMGKNADLAVSTIAADENAPVEYFNLQGVRVANPENGLFIVKKGNKTEKRVIR